MSISTVNQVIALCRRYLITIARSPISTLIRSIIFPGILIVSFVIFISSWKDDEFTISKKFKLEKLIRSLVLFSNVGHIIHFCSQIITDKGTGMKSLMLSMGLRRLSYYISYILCMSATILPLMIIIAIASLRYLFQSTLASSLGIFLVFVIATIGISSMIFAITSFITSTKYVGIVFLLVLLDNLATHYLVIFSLKNSSQSLWFLILFVASASPLESINILSDSYLLCQNCDETKYDPEQNLVSQPVHYILLAMVFWAIVTLAFARWFEEVCPWQKDSAVKKPYFCCVRKPSASHDELIVGDQRSEYFEVPQSTKAAGIKIRNLVKEFNNITAVNDITFNVYKGETTLLLGHNGAGKTTLMEMILGKLIPNRGYVAIDSTHSMEGEYGIGVCPQTSIMDDFLTVRQHLELFTDIKSSGMSKIIRSNHTNTTLEDVNLTDHAKKLPSELSGGMKRKLSLGMAFAGNSKVLILDEPSSGLDPDSRVFIWNAIRRYRSDRTVLLSTQHMEEADYLGDRIAIMSSGRIVCCGSSIFLNRIFGTGYKIRIECCASDKKNILNIIRQIFKSAKITEDDTSGTTNRDQIQDMIVDLNEKSGDNELKMIELLEKFESQASELKIRSYGLKASSLEDVLLNSDRFFNSGSGHNSSRLPPNLNILTDSSSIRTSGMFNEQLRFLYAFMCKHLSTFLRDWISVIFYRVIIVIFTTWFIVDDINSRLVSGSKSGFYTALIVIHFIHYPSLEKTSKFKTMQLTSQASFVVYWLSFWLIDAMSALVPIFFLDLLIMMTFNGLFIKSQSLVYSVVGFSTLLLYLSASLLAYIISNMITDTKNSMTYLYFLYCSSPVSNLALFIIQQVASIDLSWLDKILTKLFLALLPTETYQYVINGLGSECYIGPKTSPCNVNENSSPIFYGLLIMIGQIIVYVILLFIIEYENFDIWRYINIRNWFSRAKPKHLDKGTEIDKDVVDESTKALTVIKDVPRNTYSLIAADLSKSYIKCCPVVEHLSFTVNRAECFGLLGVNGAGKSTTFSMIVAEINSDRGRIWLNGHYSDENVNIYRKLLGYDPQSNPELSLSPVQAFYMMARLRLVDERRIPLLVQTVMDLLEINEHSKKCARDLSGGTKRKLALGMALVGNTTMLALDEPTAGVDPMARRSIWLLLKAMRSENGVSILISSHAMEECEAICDRISIMARGRLRCIGSFLHLRSKFAKGCTIKVQFTKSTSRSSTGSQPLDNSQIVTKLNEVLFKSIGNSVKLTDSNANSAVFSVSDNNVKRSLIFKTLRNFQQKYPDIRYIVDDTSLEDIFISLAREEQELKRAD